MLEEFLLYRVQIFGGSETFDGADLFAVGLDGKHQTGVDEDAIDSDRAGATVAVVATLFSTSEAERFAQDFEQGLAGLAEKLGLFSIDSSLDVYFTHFTLRFGIDGCCLALRELLVTVSDGDIVVAAGGVCAVVHIYPVVLRLFGVANSADSSQYG